MPPPAPTPAPAPAADAAPNELEKKLRSLRKKLKAIEELELKQASGEELKPEQTSNMSKIGQIAALRTRLREHAVEEVTHDALAQAGIPCFGPTKAAAELENSKAWMKDFFTRHELPTARFVTFTDFEKAKAHVESID